MFSTEEGFTQKVARPLKEEQAETPLCYTISYECKKTELQLKYLSAN